jgi:uncharacterized protein YjiS (DUF1127 family)
LCSAQFAWLLCRLCASKSALSDYIGKVTKKKEFESKMELMKNIREWRRFRATREALSRLSDRELNDLGIGRGEIDYTARRAAY